MLEAKLPGEYSGRERPNQPPKHVDAQSWVGAHDVFSFKAFQELQIHRASLERPVGLTKSLSEFFVNRSVYVMVLDHTPRSAALGTRRNLLLCVTQMH